MTDTTQEDKHYVSKTYAQFQSMRLKSRIGRRVYMHLQRGEPRNLEGELIGVDDRFAIATLLMDNHDEVDVRLSSVDVMRWVNHGETSEKKKPFWIKPDGTTNYEEPTKK